MNFNGANHCLTIRSKTCRRTINFCTTDSRPWATQVQIILQGKAASMPVLRTSWRRYILLSIKISSPFSMWFNQSINHLTRKSSVRGTTNIPAPASEIIMVCKVPEGNRTTCGRVTDKKRFRHFRVLQLFNLQHAAAPQRDRRGTFWSIP